MLKNGVGSLSVALIAFLATASPVQAQPHAYVANDVSHNVSVINTATNAVVATIDIGVDSNPASVAVAPNGETVYVANNGVVAGEGTVSVIDTLTNTVSATIETGGGPYGIAITPNGAALYVTSFYASPTDTVWVIDTATHTVTASITAGSFPHGLAVTPDGSFVYVANTFSNNVSVIETVTNTVTATIPVGDQPHGIAISPNGSLAYVSNYLSGTISVIDIATNTVTATIPLSTDSIEGIVFSNDGTRAYVCHQHSDFISIINTLTNTVVGTVTVGTNPFGLALTPDGEHLYVANQGSHNVSVVSTQTNTVEATIETAPGSFPANLAITPASSGGRNLTELGPARMWIGLKNSDDQGTRFDVRAEVYKNGELVASGLTRCINGVTRNPNSALEALIAFNPFPSVTYNSGDVMSLKILTRIGTNPNDTKCPGHSNATGLRLYYDAIQRQSRFGAQLSPDPMSDFFLHTVGSNDFLDGVAPTSATALNKDSAAIAFAFGNLWKLVGTWSMTMD
jgi:YVTN family beta-propeller protein